jgi:hypothetical protein
MIIQTAAATENCKIIAKVEFKRERGAMDEAVMVFFKIMTWHLHGE